MAIILLCSIIGVFFLCAIIFPMLRDSGGRVFVSGSSQVTLRDDGTFIAMLPHNAILSGSFEEHADATVSFTHSGRTDTAQISERTLTVPDGWLPSCSHTYNPIFTLR